MLPLVLKNPQYEIKVVTTKPALHFFNSSEVDAEVITDEDEWNVSADNVLPLAVISQILRDP
jgi:hypothetical protein